MIPSVVGADTKSGAERRFFDLLSRTSVAGDSDAVVFHSLNISRHDYKIVGELDFLLVSTRGVFVFEVKGGGVECRNGLWTFTDRFGNLHRKSESPFQQARSGMFSLRTRVEQQFGDSVNRMVWGYAVVFPDTDFSVQSVEWEDPMVIDGAECGVASDLDSHLERLLNYWTAKQSRSPSPSQLRLRELQQFLRPDFERVPSLRNRADQLDAAMEHLTGEQYEQMDLIDENDRILCAGGAGTGKTFLAAELARREAASGNSVLFVASTNLLAAFVRSRVPDDVTVAAIKDLPKANFDVAIIDEGQDVLNFDDLGHLDSTIRNGLASGRWRLFYDSNRQSGLVGHFDAEALDFLRSTGAVNARLSRNCRNTHEVVLQTRLLTAADLGTPSAGHGPPVEFATYENSEHQVSLIDAHLAELAADDIAAGDVTILSSKAFHESAASRCRPARRRRLVPLDLAAAERWPINRTTFARVEEFKGLENRFILLVDFDHIDEEGRSVNELYVGMSRARTGLWIAVSEDVAGTLTEVSKVNLKSVMGDTRAAQRT